MSLTSEPADDRKEGFNYVSQALALEEQDHPDLNIILTLYKLGGQHWNRLLRDRPEEGEKIRDHLMQIRQRIRVLRTKIETGSSSPLKSNRPAVRTTPRPTPSVETPISPKTDPSLDGVLKSSIVNLSVNVAFKDVIGQEKAKEALKENVIYPALRCVCLRP